MEDIVFSISYSIGRDAHTWIVTRPYVCYVCGMLDQIQARLAKAKQRLQRTEATRAVLQKQIADLEAAIRVIQEIEGGEDASKVTASQRILDALDAIGQPTTKAELQSYLDANGDPVNPNTLTGTLQRMSGSEVFFKDGKWFLAQWRDGVVQ